MPGTPRLTPDLASFVVDESSDEPLYLQIHRGFRDSILNGRLPRGLRLPSSRSLATMWNVSRSTVLTALEQLKAEGYLEGHAGSGTFVSEAIPDHSTVVNPNGKSRRAVANDDEPTSRISQRGAVICEVFENRRGMFDKPRPFRPGVPAEGTFPSELWRRLSSRVWRNFERHQPLSLDPMFIQQGHLGRHVRRMRAFYAERHQQLRMLIREQLPMLQLQPVESGMHIIAWLPDGADDKHIARQLGVRGVVAFPLSIMCQRALPPALILGYCGWDQAQTQQALQQMKVVLQQQPGNVPT